LTDKRQKDEGVCNKKSKGELKSGELDDKELEKVAGGVRRQTTGPGTQTEDDVYVG
jgi:hypothetical protein